MANSSTLLYAHAAHAFSTFVPIWEMLSFSSLLRSSQPRCMRASVGMVYACVYLKCVWSEKNPRYCAGRRLARRWKERGPVEIWATKHAATQARMREEWTRGPIWCRALVRNNRLLQPHLCTKWSSELGERSPTYVDVECTCVLEIVMCQWANSRGKMST